MTVVLGPCRCQACGWSVFWDGMNWMQRAGSGYRAHQCRVSRKAA